MILEFLTANKQAYTQTELQRELGIKHASAVYMALHGLLNRGEIEQKIIGGKSYWGISCQENGIEESTIS